MKPGSDQFISSTVMKSKLGLDPDALGSAPAVLERVAETTAAEDCRRNSRLRILLPLFGYLISRRLQGNQFNASHL